MRINTKHLLGLCLVALSFSSYEADAQNYVTGGRGAILRTSDLGKTWTLVNDSTQADVNLEGISRFSKDTVIVGGWSPTGGNVGDGHIYRSVNGKTFRRVGGKGSTQIRDVFTFSDGKGFAAHKAYATHPINYQGSNNFGATWTDENNGLFGITAGEALANSRIGYGLWNDGRGIYRTNNSGNNWTNQFSVPSLNSVEKTAKRTIIVGDAGKAFSGTTSGSGFSPLALPGVGTLKLRKIRASVDDSTVIVVGNSGYSARSTDGGVTWAQFNIGTGNLNFVEWATDSIVFIGGAEDAVGELPLFKSTDKGATWNRIPLSAFGVRQKFTKDNFTLDMKGPLLGFMASGWRGNGNENGLYRTTDGGNSWTEYTGPFSNRNASIIQVFSIDTLLVSHFGTFGSGEIFLSTDGANNFNFVGGDRAGKYAFYFLNRREGYAAGEIGIWRTTNGGTSWTQLPDGNVQSPIYDLNKGIAVGAFGKALITTDYQTYTPISPLGYVAGTFRDVQVVSATEAYVTGDKGSIFRTLDGQNWNYIGDTAKLQNLRSVHFSSTKSGWAVGVQGTVLHTSDSAKTWVQTNLGGTRNLNDVYFLNDSVGIVVGDSGLAWTTANAGANWNRVYVGTRANLFRAWMGDTVNQPSSRLFTLKADSARGFAGETVSIKVSAKSFYKLRGFQGSISWDTTVARYVGVTGFGIPSLSVRNFNNSTAANQGQLRFDWRDTSATRADDSTLFVVRFRLKTATNNSTNVAFNASWLTGALDSSKTTIVSSSIDGFLQVKASPSINTGNVLFASASDTSVCASGTIRVPYAVTESFGAGNTFQVQLSDASGSFATPVNLGTPRTGTNSDTITVTVPAAALSGNGYKLRVVGTIPAVVGTPSTDGFRIIATPARPVITPAGALAICPGDSLELSAPAGFTSYLWNNGATTRSIFVRGASSNTVQVFSGACPSVASAAVNTTAANQPSAPNISVTGSLVRCEGDSVQLTAPSANAYRWSTGATTRSIFAKASGAYTVQVRNTATGCFSQVSNAVVTTFNQRPATPVVTSFGISNDSVRADVSGSVYLWFLNGNRQAALTGQVVKITQSGVYTVQVVANGCTSALSAPVTVTSLDSRSSLKGQISLYPNPNDGQFKLETSALDVNELTLSVRDLAGRTLHTSQLEVFNGQTTTDLNLNGLARGTYMVHLQSQDGRSRTIKMVIR